MTVSVVVFGQFVDVHRFLVAGCWFPGASLRVVLDLSPRLATLFTTTVIISTIEYVSVRVWVEGHHQLPNWPQLLNQRPVIIDDPVTIIC